MRRRSFRRRSPVEWGVRAVLALTAILLGYGAVTHALAYAIHKRATARAHLLAPDDGKIAGVLAATLSDSKADPAARVQSDEIAKSALRQDPTAVAAVSTLGLSAQLRGDTESARRLFAYSEALSRRDLKTQLWGIEDAVARNDVPAVLRHYDIALRTSRVAPDLLFPILASAITAPEIRTDLIRTLLSKPSWSDAFIDYASQNGDDARATATLLDGVRRAGLPVSTKAQALVINRLTAGKFFDEAWGYYASVRPGVKRAISRDERFVADIRVPSAFDWIAINGVGITTSIQRNDQGGVFDFATPPSVGGPVLRQLQMLPAGEYVLDGHSEQIDQPRSSRPYWLLTCLNGKVLGRVDMPNSAEANGRFSGYITVSEDCPVQILTLTVRASNRMAGVTGQIDQVLMRPAG